MMNKSWEYKFESNKQPRYQPVVDCILFLVLGSFNNCNIIQFTIKTTSSEDFDVVHKLFLDGINENMASLIHLRKYGAINVVDTTTMSYYSINCLYKPYTIQEDLNTHGQVSMAGEIVVQI